MNLILKSDFHPLFTSPEDQSRPCSLIARSGFQFKPFRNLYVLRERKPRTQILLNSSLYSMSFDPVLSSLILLCSYSALLF